MAFDRVGSQLTVVFRVVGYSFLYLKLETLPTASENCPVKSRVFKTLSVINS